VVFFDAATGLHHPPVRLGIDNFLDDPGPVRGRRIGLVTHKAACTRDGRSTAAALIQHPALRVAALFAPEHGNDGILDAGEPVPTMMGRTPIYSLYGPTLRPIAAMLEQVGAGCTSGCPGGAVRASTWSGVRPRCGWGSAVEFKPSGSWPAGRLICAGSSVSVAPSSSTRRAS